METTAVVIRKAGNGFILALISPDGEKERIYPKLEDALLTVEKAFLILPPPPPTTETRRGRPVSDYEDGGRNYYDFPPADPIGLRYRLEGDDVITGVVNILRGGVIQKKDGSVEYNERYRLMNDEGIARVELFIRGGVNKINHLTKYKNEERIMRQMRSLLKAFTIELTLNLKRWAPNATTVEEDAETVGIDGEMIRTKTERLINPHGEKVRNKHIVLQVVENSLFQSMQRGGEGFEAEITGKSWVVNEQVGQQQQAEPRGVGGLRGLFSRRGSE